MEGALFPTSFESATDLTDGRPLIIDILMPDKETSLLPPELKYVMHVNPQNMQLQYSNGITRQQTRGGFIENHWGKALQGITFDNVTGGFMRLYAGLSNKTGVSAGGTLQGNGSASTAVQGRRETIAYDKYLDYLALFESNAASYDARGNIVQQGYMKVTFDEGVYLGWFEGDLQMTEVADRPYLFQFTSQFQVDEELQRFKSTVLSSPGPSSPLSGTPASTVFPPAQFAGLFSET